MPAVTAVLYYVLKPYKMHRPTQLPVGCQREPQMQMGFRLGSHTADLQMQW